MSRRHLIVDAMNVIGTRPTGWWRDRDAALRRLAELLRLFAGEEDQAVTLVADGRPLADLPEGDYDGIRVLYGIRSGPNAADERILQLLESLPEHSTYEVVTSDRELMRRVRRLGAETRRPSALLRRLDELEQAGWHPSAQD